MLCLASAVMAGGAGAQPSALTVKQFGPWTFSGDRVVFFGSQSTSTSGVLSWRVRASAPTRVAPTCPRQEQTTALALAAKRVVCLSRIAGNTERFDTVDSMSLSGAARTHVDAARGDPNGVSDEIRLLVSNGTTAWYVKSFVSGQVRLMRVTPAGGKRLVRVLGELQGKASTITGGNADGSVIAIAHGSVDVYSPTGKHLATIPGSAAEVAVRKKRVVVLTKTHKLQIYTSSGALVRAFPVPSRARFLSTYYGYATYLQADHLLRVVKLTTGKDRVLERFTAGHLWDGAQLQAPGVVLPETRTAGSASPVTLRFIPLSRIRALVG